MSSIANAYPEDKMRATDVATYVMHDLLPNDARVSRDRSWDSSPDIFAAIMLEDIKLDTFLDNAAGKIRGGGFDDLICELVGGKTEFDELTPAEKSSERERFYKFLEKFLRLAFDFVSSWVKEFPVDKPTIVKLW